MNTIRGISINEYMLGKNYNSSKSSTAVSKVFSNSKTLNTTSNTKITSTKNNIYRILSYLLAILIVIIVILLFVNYFITPIFKLHPGAPGIISVPGVDNGILFWNSTSAGQILNKDLPIASHTSGYTMNLDVFIENPLLFSTTPRVFFSRGAHIKHKPSGNTLLSMFKYYNIVAALLPDTNDVIVSVLNKDNNMENIIISNVPVQQPFRLSMVVMEQALEVYINGFLIKTRTFTAPPKDVKGDIYPATGIEANAIKVRNLKIWSRLLSVTEIREAIPSLSTANSFGAGPMPSSTSCGTSIISDIENNMSDYTNSALGTVDSISNTVSNML